MELEVLYGPDHETASIALPRGRAHLTWGDWDPDGNQRGWTLFYWEDDSETAGIESHQIPGDLLDVDEAVREAQAWLTLRRGGG